MIYHEIRVNFVYRKLFFALSTCIINFLQGIFFLNSVLVHPYPNTCLSMLQKIGKWNLTTKRSFPCTSLLSILHIIHKSNLHSYNIQISFLDKSNALEGVETARPFYLITS